MVNDLVARINAKYHAIYKEKFKKSSFNLDSFLTEAGDKVEGEKILCVFTYAMDEDIKGGVVGKSSQGKLLRRLFDYINNEQVTGDDKTGYKSKSDIPLIKSFICVSFRDFQPGENTFPEKNIACEENKIWTDRIIDYIKEYKPTRIWLLGDYVYKCIQYHYVKNPDPLYLTEPFLSVGRVFNLEVDSVTYPCSFDVSMHLTGTTNPKYKDTMPYLIHEQKFNLETLLHGKNRYTVTPMETWKSIDIMSREDFDGFYGKLVNTKVVCLDLETKNLARKANKILTIHFALDETTAYNLPVEHRETPMSGEDIIYIKEKLKNYFQDGISDYLVMHNAKFDVSVLMGQLKLKHFNHKIFDSIGGKYCFHPDTVVATSKGNMAIKDIYKHPEELAVWSFNHETKRVELKPVVNKFKLPNTKKMLEIDYGGGKVRVTEDHKLWSVSSNCYKEAKDFEIGEEVLLSKDFIVSIGKIRSINTLDSLDTVYELTVKDNHNLFVKGSEVDSSYVLAHNCLGENSKFFLDGLNIPIYNLRALAHSYGCAAYEVGELSKDQRANMENHPLKDIFEYAAKDVIIPYQVHKFQVQEAERRGYTNWKEFIIEQLGAMILVFCKMEVTGILVDIKYLMYQMSNDGEVGKLLRNVTDWFRESEHAKWVNEKLVLQVRMTEAYKDIVALTKEPIKLIKSSYTKAKKPVVIKKSKVKKNLDLFIEETPTLKETSIEDEQEKKDKLIEVLKGLAKLFGLNLDKDKAEEDAQEENDLPKDIVGILKWLKSKVEKSVFNLDPDTYKGELLPMVRTIVDFNIQELKHRIEKDREVLPQEVTEVLLTFCNILSEKLETVYDTEASRPVDINNKEEWLFSISERDSQQLLFFHRLKLTPIEDRKDGGGKTNKEFQEVYSKEYPEVENYDKYTKYKKVQSTYIKGMYDRILPMDANGNLLKDTDEALDGRLRASFDYKYVLTGRCVRGDTKILTDKGEIEIEKIVKEKIECNVLTHLGNWKPIIDWFDNGEKEVFEVITESGKKVYVTANHPLLTEQGWVELDSLKVGDKIAVQK